MRVLVTGAAGAIGAAIVTGLRAGGHAVVAHDVDPPAPPGGEVVTLSGDLRDAGRLDDELASAGIDALDAVVAAHGVAGAGALGALEPEFVRRVLEINLVTVPALLAVTRPRLLPGGRFVVVASQAGLVGEANGAAYCASKFALVGWARVMGPALARDDVHLRVLCPGCTESRLLLESQRRFARAEGVDEEESIRQRAASIPIGRFARPRETAAAAIFLATAPRPAPALLAATGGEVLW